MLNSFQKGIKRFGAPCCPKYAFGCSTYEFLPYLSPIPVTISHYPFRRVPHRVLRGPNAGPTRADPRDAGGTPRRQLDPHAREMGPCAADDA